MIGASTAFERVLEQASMAARSDARVLLEGESGTGKELLAAHIHAESPVLRRPVRQSELRRDSDRADRKRTVRPRKRRVHRSDIGPPRQIRTGRRRHAVS